MRTKLEKLQPLPLFKVLTELLERQLMREFARLEALHCKASRQPSAELPFGGM